MTAQVFYLFPLSVFKDNIEISQNEKHEIIDFITNSAKKNNDINKNEGDAWLGDVEGHEYLFRNTIMKNLSNLISEKIKINTEMLSLDNEKISFYYQRSWATITKNEERIQPHSHDQSNISFAYYLLKPKDTGDIRFITNPPNEISKGLFAKKKLDLGLLKSFNNRNAPSIDLHIEEGDIVIFPSKTKHATNSNMTENTRISISGDVVIMLKNTYGHEKLMPHFNHWLPFEE